ncbi:hypothetical protein [Streptomyces sp. A5-4]|uniref:hypothetical protein n=1 Tax=Streptomyces sp. A5-4 TaxID=3384771 RepID=UPI003DA7F2D7
MLILNAVLERYHPKDFSLWPVADLSVGGMLPLSGRLSPREVGTAMAILTNYNKGSRHRRRGSRDPEDGESQVRRLVTAECVIAPGGLRVQDTSTGLTASPGCCSGLESWRDWLDLADGGEPWLGHDPTPLVEHTGATVRLWPGGNSSEGLPVDLPLAQLPELLRSVQDDLVGFLARVAEWSTHYAPSLAAALVAKLDAELAVGAPL